jgi:superfamily II DNA/RNA helicase
MTYVHRIGRTARAGKSGTSVTLVDWDDLAKWKMICDTLNLPLHEPVETYSTSEHLFLELSIPTSAKGVLPRAARTRAGLDAEAVEDLGGPNRKKPSRGDRPSAGRSSRAEGSGRSRTRTDATAGGPESEGEHKPSATRNRRRRRTRAGAPVSGNAPAEQSSAG